MFTNELEQELKKYKRIERTILYLDIFIALLLIFFSQKLINTTFGQATLWFALTMLGIIAILRTFKMIGPKN
ncbi:MAG: hypothetical protein AABX96_01865 [Nanoarchaeota archaeon]